MATRYINDVAKLCRVQVSELGIEGLYEIPAQKRLVEDFILKKGLFVGDERRHISDEFMLFMSEWGQECLTRDEETGAVLLELAMQRISRGGIPHDEYDLLNSLPEKYRQYSAKNDEPAPLTNACWQFIKTHLRFCYEALNNATWRQHAKLIFFGIIVNINEDGSFNGDFRLDENNGVNAIQIRKWASHQAGICFSFYERAILLAPVWRKNRDYFKYIENVIDWYCPEILEAFKHDEAIDRYGKPYFSRRTKIFLKIFGMYQLVLITRIRQDIRQDVKA